MRRLGLEECEQSNAFSGLFGIRGTDPDLIFKVVKLEWVLDAADPALTCMPRMLLLQATTFWDSIS